MLLPRLARDWLAGTLSVEFHRLEVLRLDGSLSWTGHGRLGRSNGGWTLESHTDQENADLREYRAQHAEVVAGEPFPSSSLRRVVAFDQDNNRWTFDRLPFESDVDIFPLEWTELPRHKLKMTWGVSELSVQYPRTSGTPHAQVAFALPLGARLPHTHFCDVDDPERTTLRLLQTQDLLVGETEITAFQRQDDLWFSIPAAADATAIGNSLNRALIFALSAPLFTSVVVPASADIPITLREHKPFYRHRLDVLQPIPLWHKDQQGSAFWRAVTSYASKHLNRASPAMALFDDVWWNVACAATSPKWVRSLVVCACIEAYARATTVGVPEERRELTAAEARLLDLSNRDPHLAALKPDIEKWLASRQTTGTNKAVRRLLECGILTRCHFDAWNAVRHRYAHGHFPSRDDDNSIAQMWVLGDALIRCTLHEIGYDGPSYRFSERGWPVVRHSPRRQ